MTKRALTAIDNRPFFEKVLSHGHKIGVIPKAKVDEILESGPRGIFQIAEKFGTPYMQPHLLSAKHRIVNLVSLYLENASKWDVDAAAHILADQKFLSLSKGGSQMIKYLNQLPTNTLWILNPEKAELYDDYEMFAPGNKWWNSSEKNTHLNLLSEYNTAKNLRLNNANTRAACLWLMRKLPRVPADTYAAFNVREVVTSFLLCQLNGVEMIKIPSELEIRWLLEKSLGKKIDESAVLADVPSEYESIVKEFIQYTNVALKKRGNINKNLDFFARNKVDIADLDRFEGAVDENWKNLLWAEKQLTDSNILTILLTALTLPTPQLSITALEAEKIMNQLMFEDPEIDNVEILDNFFLMNIPFIHRDRFESLRSELKEVMKTICGHEKSLFEKIKLLEKTGLKITK